jgi:hypothetical protein
VTADSNLSDRDPTDLRSDNVLIFEGIGGKVAVIAEVQKDKVLNILTGDLDLSNRAVRMFALLAIAEAPIALREGYTRIIRAVAPESARAALEELMMTHLKDAFVDGLLDQGRAEGVAKGEAQMLLRIMTARGLDPGTHPRPGRRMRRRRQP